MNFIRSRGARWFAATTTAISVGLLVGCGGGGNGGGGDTNVGSLDKLQANTQQGVVVGAESGNAVAFRGVPFAAPPVASLRWKPPQPPAVRTGTYDATAYKPACIAQEDCLYLNVFKPNDAKLNENLPVFFWIHGGAFRGDAGMYFDGTALATENRMVVVAIDYRLAGAGFFAHPAITAEGNGAAANYGLLDQIAALKWVKENIAAFGGDPKNVTIGGESAGAVSVAVHLASPMSQGLFHKALGISGGVIRQDFPLAGAETQGMTDAAKLGCPGSDAAAAACLRAVPYATLQGSGGATPYSRGNWVPVIDGKLLNESTAVAFEAGRFNKVPTLMGAMHNERSLGAKSFANAPLTADNYAAQAVKTMPFVTATEIQGLYPVANFKTPTHAYLEAVGDFGWFCQTLWDAQNISRNSPATWGFEFAQQEQAQTIPDASPAVYPGATLAFYGPWGNFHSASNPYWFGQFAQADRTASNIALSGAMRSYLANFARTGDPNGDNLPKWSRLAESSGKAIYFQSPIRTDVDVMTPHQCGFWKDKPLTDTTY